MLGEAYLATSRGTLWSWLKGGIGGDAGVSRLKVEPV